MSHVVVNITLQQELIDVAQALNMDLSQTCEHLLTRAIGAEIERRGSTRYSAYVGAYNATVDSEGLPLASSRSF